MRWWVDKGTFHSIWSIFFRQSHPLNGPLKWKCLRMANDHWAAHNNGRRNDDRDEEPDHRPKTGSQRVGFSHDFHSIRGGGCTGWSLNESDTFTSRGKRKPWYRKFKLFPPNPVDWIYCQMVWFWKNLEPVDWLDHVRRWHVLLQITHRRNLTAWWARHMLRDFLPWGKLCLINVNSRKMSTYMPINLPYHARVVIAHRDSARTS